MIGIYKIRLGNLILGLGIIAMISCSSKIADKPLRSDNNGLNSSIIENQAIDPQSDSLISIYLGILDGLKCEYILFAKLPFHSIGKLDYVKFNSDSVKYFDSYNSFFNQDCGFINWLLTFKGDTSRSGLWQKYHNPISSYLGECHLPMTNERAAINLIENFLNGDKIICHECGRNDSDCNESKYELIKKFISNNRNKSIKDLRDEWKKNAH